jgi:hypothetical protein
VRRPLAFTPPSTLAGLKLMDAMVRIRTPRVAVFKTSFAEAVHVAFLQFASLLAVVVIDAVVLPLFLQTAHVYTNEDSHNDDCQDDRPVHDKISNTYKQD